MGQIAEYTNKIQPGTEAKQNLSRSLILAVSFLLLTTLKTTVVNFIMMNTQTIGSFGYKFIFTLAVYLVISVVLLKLRSRILLLVLYLVQTAYLISMLCYFNYFHNYLHLFQSAALFTEGMGAVKHFTIPIDYDLLVMLIDIPAFVLLFISYARHLTGLDYRFKAYRRLLLILPLLLLLALEGWNYVQGDSVFQLIRNYAAHENQIVEQYGTLINSTCDIIANQGGKSLIEQFDYGAAVTSAFATTTPPNFVAIQVESMDSHAVDHQYYSIFLHSFEAAGSKEMYFA